MSTQSYAPLSTYHFGDMRVDYVEEPECQTVGLFLYPGDMADELVSHREFLPWQP